MTLSVFWIPRAETAAAKASSDGNMCGNWFKWNALIL